MSLQPGEWYTVIHAYGGRDRTARFVRYSPGEPGWFLLDDGGTPGSNRYCNSGRFTREIRPATPEEIAAELQRRMGPS